MEKEDKRHIILISLIFGGIILFVVILLIALEPVTDKLEATCNEYGMTYVYRNGGNCLDKNNVLHPIHSECPQPHQRGLCEIRFIQSPT